MAESTTVANDTTARQINFEEIDPVFETELDRKYVCPICLSYLKDPMQTSCGHRFCGRCVSQLVESSSRIRDIIRCPVDKHLIVINNELFKDIAVNREVQSLGVLCNNSRDGCPWRGELGELRKHLWLCNFLMEDCVLECGKRVPLASMSEHLKRCERRLVECEHCHEQQPFMALTKHQVLSCQMLAVPCTLCGKTGILRKDIPQHIAPNHGDCQYAKIPCQYASFGCDFMQNWTIDVSKHGNRCVLCETEELRAIVVSYAERRNMPEHYVEVDTHLQLLMKHIMKQDAKIFQLESKLQQLSLG